MKNTQADQIVRNQLVSFLKDRNAHVNLEDVLRNFPMEHINSRIEDIEYSPWQLLEHLRLTQRDIIEFIEDPNYQTPDFPAGYWPEKQLSEPDLWNKSVQEFFDDRDHLERIVKDSRTDLYGPMPAGEKYSVLR